MPGMGNAGEHIDELVSEPKTEGADSAFAAHGELDEERRRALHASFNRRISHLCKLAALVIAVVAFATIAVGQETPKFVLMGLCLSVALLAIAMLQDHYQNKQ